MEEGVIHMYGAVGSREKVREEISREATVATSWHITSSQGRKLL